MDDTSNAARAGSQGDVSREVKAPCLAFGHAESPLQFRWCQPAALERGQSRLSFMALQCHRKAVTMRVRPDGCHWHHFRDIPTALVFLQPFRVLWDEEVKRRSGFEFSPLRAFDLLPHCPALSDDDVADGMAMGGGGRGAQAKSGVRRAGGAATCRIYFR
jgi:hypothetical protein